MKAKRVFRFWILGLVTVCSLLRHHADAQQVVCGTLAQCLVLRGRVEARIQELLRNVTPILGDIVRNADGSVREMDSIEASNYCESQGSRLPSVREFALFAQSRGARGIRETANAGIARTEAAVQAEIAQMRAAGYFPVYTMKDGSNPLYVVDFYFDSTGYQRPPGDPTDRILWSRSFLFGVACGAYVLTGGNGDIGHVSCYYTGSRGGTAVRCVR